MINLSQLHNVYNMIVGIKSNRNHKQNNSSQWFSFERKLVGTSWLRVSNKITLIRKNIPFDISWENNKAIHHHKNTLYNPHMKENYLDKFLSRELNNKN